LLVYTSAPASRTAILSDSRPRAERTMIGTTVHSRSWRIAHVYHNHRMEAVRSPLIESQVDCQYVHAWFSQNPKGATLGVLGSHLAHCLLAQPTGSGNAPHLIFGSRGADVGIKATGGGGDQVDWDGGRVVRVRLLERLHTPLDGLEQRWIEWSIV